MRQIKNNSEESHLLKLNHEISNLLTSTTSLSSTLNHLLSICCKIEGIHGGALYLTDRITDGLRLVSHCGLSSQILNHIRNYDFSTPETIFVQNGKSVYLHSFETDPGIFASKQVKQQGMNLIAIIPVSYDNNTVANLNLYSYEVDRLTSNSRLALEAFAMRIGAIVARVNAVLFSQESEQRYRSLLETMNEGFIILDENFIVAYGNNKICEMLGYRFDEILGLPVSFFLDEVNKGILEKQIRKKSGGKNLSYEIAWIKADRKAITTKVAPRAIVDKLGIFKGSFAVITDITKINETNMILRNKERDLIEKTVSLQEVNTALRVVLKKRDEDKNELEEKVVSNIEQLVIPLLGKIKERKLDSTQKSLFEILESNLANIVSPFSKNLFSKHLELTSTEFDISNFIREGKTTKELAEIMGVSCRTIETHRFRIRKKLDLNNTKISLRSYLLSLQ